MVAQRESKNSLFVCVALHCMAIILIINNNINNINNNNNKYMILFFNCKKVSNEGINQTTITSSSMLRSWSGTFRSWFKNQIQLYSLELQL
jgi:hypothetical protein